MDKSEMKLYVGLKFIRAMPMNRQAYNDFRGWALPHDENGADEGFLVEYLDGGKPNTREFDGYVSWSPKEVFENAYRILEGNTFGYAIEALKRGHSLARKGWNGSGIFIKLAVPDELDQMTQPFIFIDTTGLQTTNPNAPKGRVPWLASQTDMLAEDWEVVG